MSNVMNMPLRYVIAFERIYTQGHSLRHWTETEVAGCCAEWIVKTAGCLKQRLLEIFTTYSGIQYIKMLPPMGLILLARFLSRYVRVSVSVCLPVCLVSSFSITEPLDRLHEIWYVHYAIRGEPTPFHFCSLQSEEGGVELMTLAPILSRCSNDLRPGFDFQKGNGTIVSSTVFRPPLGHTQLPIQWVPGTSSPGVKWPGREADHSHPSMYGSTTLVDLGRFFSFLIYTKSVGLLEWGISPSKGHYLHTTTQTQNKRTQASMPRVGFEPKIPVFDREETVHTLDRDRPIHLLLRSKIVELYLRSLIRLRGIVLS
jgi:hypothetical protein